MAAVGVVGGAGVVAEDCSIGLGSGALRGAYSAVKAYITAIDKTKARMTRFSIQDQSDFLFRIALSHRIESPAMQGVTSEQSPDGADDSAKKTILFDGFNRVFGTCRRESAGGRQPRRNDQFVRLDELYGEGVGDIPAHLSVPRSVISSARSS